MSRGPDGTVRQPLSDTVLFGHLAYRLEGVATGQLKRWAGEHGLAVGGDALRNAPMTSARLQGAADRRAAVRPWLLVDWPALDFFVALARLQIVSSAKRDLDALAAQQGVVDLLVFGHTALAIVVYERRRERDSLKLRLADFGDLLEWEEVEQRRPEALLSTAHDLALQAGGREGLRSRSRP